MIQALSEDGVPIVTTNHVVGESYTLLRTSLGALPATEFLLGLRKARQIEQIFVSESWEESAEDLLQQYGDQPFSYVDATSFVAMRRLGIQTVLAFDQHFATAGFNLLTA
jgi:predicted nucleic acid-binding protein